MQDFNFDLIRYKRPRPYIGKRTLRHIIGIDSEAYIDGTPFMFPTSLGECILPREWPECLQRRDYRSANFVTWNLRYDAGAFLRHLPSAALEALRLMGEVEWEGWRYKYFPHKFLRIGKGRNRATFWDVMPFYECSLEKASRDHLGEGKMELPTKKFSRSYVKANWDKLACYGVRDASLTKRLADHLIEGLERFDMKVSALYSQASISRRYFTQNAGIMDVWKPWRSRKLALSYACESYWGGKFEPTQRGKFNGRQYDIKSAYPFEMSRLVDVREGKITRSKTRPDSACYGSIRVRLQVPPRVLHSIPVRVSNVSMFPCGEFSATITAAELEDLRKQPVKLEVLDGFWFTSKTDSRPYEKVVAHLYQMKEGAGKSDPWIRRLAKKLLNAYYGSLVMLTPKYHYCNEQGEKVDALTGTMLKMQRFKHLRAGTCWNPIYGAVITANTRLRVTQAQRRLGAAAIAVHTDSILTTGRLPKSWLGGALGDWALERSGEGLLIGSGVYDLGEKIAFRGLKVRDGVPWRKRLKDVGSGSVVKVPVTVVPSLLGAVSRGKRKEANVFVNRTKNVDLNSDVKRIWEQQATASNLLEGLQKSHPQVIIR